MNKSKYLEGVFHLDKDDDFSNKITIIAKAGKGSYGNVYKAHYNDDSTKFYAFKKIISDKHSNQSGFPLSTLREIKVLQSCDNENIVKLHDVFTSKKSEVNFNLGSTFLVLEYCEHDFSTQTSRVDFTLSEIKCFMKQLLEGCAYLHKRKFLHRDLKPRNLLLNNDGILKIADFGLAKLHNDQFAQLSANMTTLWYKAPEVFFDNYFYSNKIDIWAIGCILAEFLIKKPIFTGSSACTQLRSMYNILGAPEENWPEVKEYKYWYELKPQKEYRKQLFNHIKEKSHLKIDDLCLDLLDRLLCYNPDSRISAETALQHPWFEQEPVACQPKNIRKFKMEYHETLISDLKYRKEVKEAKEKAENIKKIKYSESPIKANIENISVNTIEPKKSVNRLRMLIGDKHDPLKTNEIYNKSEQKQAKQFALILSPKTDKKSQCQSSYDSLKKTVEKYNGHSESTVKDKNKKKTKKRDRDSVYKENFSDKKYKDKYDFRKSKSEHRNYISNKNLKEKYSINKEDKCRCKEKPSSSNKDKAIYHSIRQKFEERENSYSKSKKYLKISDNDSPYRKNKNYKENDLDLPLKDRKDYNISSKKPTSPKSTCSHKHKVKKNIQKSYFKEKYNFSDKNSNNYSSCKVLSDEESGKFNFYCKKSENSNKNLGKAVKRDNKGKNIEEIFSGRLKKPNNIML